jgi:hypothetical protein
MASPEQRSNGSSRTTAASGLVFKTRDNARVVDDVQPVADATPDDLSEQEHDADMSRQAMAYVSG